MRCNNLADFPSDEKKIVSVLSLFCDTEFRFPFSRHNIDYVTKSRFRNVAGIETICRGNEIVKHVQGHGDHRGWDLVHEQRFLTKIQLDTGVFVGFSWLRKSRSLSPLLLHNILVLSEPLCFLSGSF